MRQLILLFIFAYTLTTFGQEKNIFLDRTFWKAQPSVELIKQKIAEGNDPSASDDFSFDGVSYGIIDKAPIESIKYMLSLEGNPVTKPTHGGVTYLLWSAYKGNMELTKHLLSLGSDIKMKTSHGTNILLMAAIGGVDNKAMYELLLSNGVDIHTTNSNGANVLLSLAGSKAENKELFQYLVDQGLKWDDTDDSGNGLFNYAARSGNIKIMKMCIDKNLDYKTINDKGENALLYASYGLRRGKVKLETFTFLKELGLEVDVVNWEGKTPLHNAIRKANPEVIDFFVTNGVNVNQIDKNGNTAFINAVGGKLENIEKLLPLIKDINHQNHNGYSALSMAVKKGSKDAFDFLVEKGADPTVLDVHGNDLMSIAFQSFSSRRKEALEHIMNALNTQSLSPKKSYGEGNTLAHYAVEHNSTFLVEKAIELGADLNLKNDTGISAFHLATMKAKDRKIIDIMLTAGANKNALTKFNESAYQLASENELLAKNQVNIDMLRLND